MQILNLHVLHMYNSLPYVSTPVFKMSVVLATSFTIKLRFFFAMLTCSEVIWELRENPLAGRTIGTQATLIISHSTCLTTDQRPIHITISLQYYHSILLNNSCEVSKCFMCLLTVFQACAIVLNIQSAALIFAWKCHARVTHWSKCSQAIHEKTKKNIPTQISGCYSIKWNTIHTIINKLKKDYSWTKEKPG
jgi:hypothetical protein